MKTFIYPFISFIIILLISCKDVASHEPTMATKRGVIAKNEMVVSARKEASEIGVAIMKKGGNAFDAMMATEMALAVTYPYAGNLGGGGFMVYRLANGDIGALDYREKAPLAASKHMYLDAQGNVIPDKSTVGAFAVAIPGTIAGIFEAHKKFGKLEVADILEPVIALAERGFVVTEQQEARFDEFDSIFRVVNGKAILYHKDIKAGDTIKNLALAKTLQRIATDGRDAFYRGEIAENLVFYITQKGGIITIEDFIRYEAVWRDPITFHFKDLKVISMSPPSSGGICLAQIMKMIEPFDLKSYGHNSLETIQVLAEAERRAYADRSFYLGDPDFVSIPTETLLSDAYLQERMQDFSFERATVSDSISNGVINGYESDETTHYSIVDSYGNAIAVTTTLNGAYGSKLYVDELGFFLNNEMDDFSSKPNVPNVYGLLGGEANSIAPQKRMLSAMTPTIVEKDGILYMTLGTPGSSTIITSVLQTILNVEVFDMSMQEAVNAPRFHHQWLPDEIRMEHNVFDMQLKQSLVAKGYTINEKRTPVIGKVDGILIMPDGRLEGGADHRGDDKAVGF